MQATTLNIETEPAPQDLQFLEERINEHNMAITGYYDFQWLTIFVRDATQTIVAGLVGYTWGQSCKIQLLWVQPALHNQGYGKGLLQAAEAEATQRGCHTIVLDTHSFQAPAFYEKLGYTVVGVYTDSPYQHKQFFLQKDLPRSNIMTMIQLRPIQPSEQAQLRAMAEAYWHEIMPTADVVQDAERRTRYLQERFPLDDEERRVQWAIAEGRVVGFLAMTINLTSKQVMVEDFYILRSERRKGYGAAMIQALYQQLGKIDIEVVELTVRRDNLHALAFWEAQGFRIAHYLMRQYREPQTGQLFVGALSSDFAGTE